MKPIGIGIQQLPRVTGSTIVLFPRPNTMCRIFCAPMRFVHPRLESPNLVLAWLSCICSPNCHHCHSHTLAPCSAILMQGPKVQLRVETFSQKSSCASSNLSPHSCQWPNLFLIAQGRDCCHQQSLSLQNLLARLLL